MPGLVEKHNASAPDLQRSETRMWKKELYERPKKKFERHASVPALTYRRNDTVDHLSNQSSLLTENEQTLSRQNGDVSYDADIDTYSDDSESNLGHTEVFGFQTKAVYEQQTLMTNMMGVLYNGRIHRFIILDSRGISSWLPGSYAADTIKREFIFPKYKTKLLRTLIFCKKYNVYFAICNDFTLKVFNRDFHETCKAKNESLHSLLHLNFNPITDELISSGVAGTTIWKYAVTDKHIFETLKPMANYELRLYAEHPHVGGSWCSKVELDVPSQSVFYCSECDLHAYGAQDYRKLFEIHNAHNGSITCVGYSTSSKLLITGGADAEVKVWGSAGGHICTLRGHSRSISSVIVHPRMPGLVFTGSLDGVIKVWSLHTMDLFHTINASPDGIHWMRLTDDGCIWCANTRKIIVLKFNPVVTFWGHARCQIVKLSVLEHQGKSKRIVALGEDSSVRLFSQSKVNASALCTVLPPPVVSLLSSVKDVTVSRFNSLVFLLIDPTKLWIYTAKTDPACRIAGWDIPKLLQDGVANHHSSSSFSSSMIRNFEESKGVRGCTQILSGKINPSPCCCILAISSEYGFQYHTPTGICSAKSRHLLLLGLEDGRILFLDQRERLLYCELKVHKEAISSMKHEPSQNLLITQCNSSQGAIFQIWNLPEVEIRYTLCIGLLPTCYTVLGTFLITGHHTGHVFLHCLEDYGEMALDWNDYRPEHREKVICVNSCRKREIFCSCSSEGVIKIWSFDKSLLADVRLGESVSSCEFLNDNADLIIGWKHQLFSVHHKTLGFKFEDYSLSENWENESDIYEDPAIRYESLVKRKSVPKVINMKRYLVPYGFIAVDNKDHRILDVTVKQEPEIAESQCSEETIRAMTETYLSPSPSVTSLGTIDSLFEIKSRALTMARTVNDLEQFGMMPEFGVSPRPSSSESTVSYSQEGEDEVFDDNEMEPGMDSSLLNYEEKKVDLQKTLSTGVLVSTAYKKMGKSKKPPIGDITEENEHVSRFGGKNMKSRKLLKSGMNAAFAVETFKSNSKKKQLSGDSRPPSFRNIVKKTRRHSSAGARERLIPTDINVKFINEKNLPDAETSQKLDENILEKLEGLKMTPHSKPGTAAGRLQSNQSLLTRNQRKKLSSAGFPAKSGRHSSNRLRRRYCKSATGGSRKSAGKLSHGFTTGSRSALQETKQNQEIKAEESRKNSVSAGDAIAILTDVHMKHSKFVKLPEQGVDKDIDPNNTKEFNRLKMSSSSGISNQIQHSYEDHMSQSQHEERKGKPDDDRNFDMVDIERLLTKCRGLNSGTADSDDDDDSILPNLLEYDFHAIYKKDGLQFDENWQNRMLDRYLLMKLQKQQRQEAAMSKRVYLEQEKRLRYITAQPDLVQKFDQPWYDDHETLAGCILNSSLIRGESPSAIQENTPSHSISSSRPVSSASNIQRNLPDGYSEKDGKFRFTIRPKSSRQMYEDDTENPFSPRAASAKSSQMARSKSVSNFSPEKRLVERPRSSTSIPGKTRYILIKPDKEKKRANVRNPTKLEEGLLLKRFPSQHCNVMKSLGRINKTEMLQESEGELHEISFHEIATRPLSPYIPKIVHGHFDSGSATIERSISPCVPKHSLESLKSSTVWKSPFSEAYINPMDIVKRKSVEDNRRTIEINLQSIHT